MVGEEGRSGNNHTSVDRDRGPRKTLAVSLFINLVALSTAYVACHLYYEDCLYFSDMGLYQDLARQYLETARQSPLEALRQIHESTKYDYNGYFTIPLLPVLYIWGDTRLIFILGIALIYGIPYALVLGSIARDLSLHRKLLIFWITAFVTLFTPAFWAATLGGYPDVGGGMLMALAAWIYIRRSRDGLRVLDAAGIGVMLGAAMLFRRHFTYGAAAFLAALGIHSLMELAVAVKRGENLLPSLKKRILWPMIAGIVLLAVLAVFGSPFLKNLLTFKASQLYQAYEKSLLEQIHYYVAQFGLLPVLLSLTGIFGGIFLRSVKRSETIFILLFGVLSFALWSQKARYVGSQYCYEFSFLFILGTAAFASTVLMQLKPFVRYTMIVVAITVFLINVLTGFSPLYLRLQNYLPSIWFSTHLAPMKTPYAEVLKRMVDDLRLETGGKSILAAAYGNIFSFEILEAAEKTMYGPADRNLKVLQSPVIDTRDRYPSELFAADYVLTVTPFIHIMSEQDTEVTRVLYQALESERWPIAGDFERLPASYQLGDYTVHVYQRIRQSEIETIVDALLRMIRGVSDRPGGQPDWISLRTFLIASISREPGDAWFIETHVAKPESGEANCFAHVGPLPKFPRLTGVIRVPDERSEGARLVIQGINGSGDIVQTSTVQCQSNTDCDFSEEFDVPGIKILLIQVYTYSDDASIDYGRVEIHQLRVEGGTENAVMGSSSN